MLPVLFGQDKKGGFKQWSVSVDDATITVSHGKVGGAITEKVSPPCKSKGKGAAMTTPQEQATKEAAAKHQKQLDQGYGPDKDNLPKITLPPLAKKYEDVKPDLSKEKPWLASNKMDGVRMTAFYRDGEVFFQSRGGKAYPVIKEIAEELYDLFFSSSPDCCVDGELHRPGMFLEDIISAVKKHNENTHLIDFHVFDVVMADSNSKFQERYHAYYGWITEQEHKKVRAVYHRRITDEDMLYAMHKTAVNHGYEGVVLRDPDSVFKFNYRTAEFLKLKISMSEEFELAGTEIDKDGGGTPVCYLPGMKAIADAYFAETGKWGKRQEGVFRATYKGTHIHRMQLRFLLGDKCQRIMHLTVDFEAYSKYNVPLKPVGRAIREMDDSGRPLV